MKIQWIATTRTKTWQNASCAPGRASEVNLRIGDERHQTWEGWGGCFNELGWMALSSVNAAQREEVMRALFDPSEGCRFNIGRVPIGASDYAAEWYSHNETAGDLAMERFSIARDERFLIPYIRAAQALRPDLKLFASPWSPPTWMKFPCAYNYGTLRWTPEILRAYALYFVRFVEAYRLQGLRISQVHPQNEPVADQKFPSCLWTGSQLREFIRDYLGPAFARHGLDCEIWLGTLNTDDYDGFVNAVLADPDANRFIFGIGLQWAGKGMAQRVAAAWPEKKLMQTENECGDGNNTWEYAHHVFNLVHHYAINGSHAYVYWNMALAPTGLSTWGWRQNAMVTVDAQSGRITYNPEFYVMRHFSRFIAPGAVRLETKGPMSANAVAFENPEGSRVVVVANPLKTERRCVLGEGQRAVTMLLQPESFNSVLLLKGAQ